MDYIRQIKAFTAFSQLFDFRADQVKVDNAVFRLHSQATVMILMVGTMFVSMRQYFGEPIECMAGRSDIPPAMLQHYCWLESTFSVTDGTAKTTGVDVAYPGVKTLNTAAGERKVYHKYYQWVYFILILQVRAFLLILCVCSLTLRNTCRDTFRFKYALRFPTPPANRFNWFFPVESVSADFTHTLSLFFSFALLKAITFFLDHRIDTDRQTATLSSKTSGHLVGKQTRSHSHHVFFAISVCGRFKCSFSINRSNRKSTYFILTRFSNRCRFAPHTKTSTCSSTIFSFLLFAVFALTLIHWLPFDSAIRTRLFHSSLFPGCFLMPSRSHFKPHIMRITHIIIVFVRCFLFFISFFFLV